MRLLKKKIELFFFLKNWNIIHLKKPLEKVIFEFKFFFVLNEHFFAYILILIRGTCFK